MGVNDDREMLEVAQEECIRLEREVAGLAAVIAAAAASMAGTPAGFRSRFWDRTREILALSPADVLAEHDREVKAEALEAASAHITDDYLARALRARAAGIRKAGE